MLRFGFFSVLSVFLFFSSCTKEEFEEEYEGLWIPQLSGQRFENSVLLDWYKPRAYLMNIIPPNYADPDFTDIYYSRQMESGFEKLTSVDGTITSITINNLKSNTPYYFYVVLRKRGFESLKSAKIMVIPSKEERFEHIYEGKRYALGLGGVKNGALKFAFTNWNFKWQKGDNSYIEAAVLIYSVEENKVSFVDTFSYAPVWSPDGNSLAYITNKNEVAVDGHRPSHIVVYSVPENKFVHFPDGDNEIRYPDWKNGNESMVYVRNSIDSGFEIWEMELRSGTKSRLVANNPFSDNTLLNPDKPIVSPDSKKMFFEAARSTDNGGPLSIWQFSFPTKLSGPVFPTEWDDSNPAVSPNGEFLAFISNRSGEENIWLYHLKEKYFRQVTGTNEFYIRKGLGRISWVDNTAISFCGGVGEQQGILTVSVH